MWSTVVSMLMNIITEVRRGGEMWRGVKWAMDLIRRNQTSGYRSRWSRRNPRLSRSSTQYHQQSALVSHSDRLAVRITTASRTGNEQVSTLVQERESRLVSMTVKHSPRGPMEWSFSHKGFAIVFPPQLDRCSEAWTIDWCFRSGEAMDLIRS